MYERAIVVKLLPEFQCDAAFQTTELSLARVGEYTHTLHTAHKQGNYLTV